MCTGQNRGCASMNSGLLNDTTSPCIALQSLNSHCTSLWCAQCRESRIPVSQRKKEKKPPLLFFTNCDRQVFRWSYERNNTKMDEIWVLPGSLVLQASILHCYSSGDALHHPCSSPYFLLANLPLTTCWATPNMKNCRNFSVPAPKLMNGGLLEWENLPLSR